MTCGAGVDTVDADPVDTLAADCEPTPAPAAPAPAPAGGDTPTGVFAKSPLTIVQTAGTDGDVFRFGIWVEV